MIIAGWIDAPWIDAGDASPRHLAAQQRPVPPQERGAAAMQSPRTCITRTAVLTFRSLPAGDPSRDVYDTTPMLAARTGYGIDGLLSLPRPVGFWMKAKDDAVNEDDQEGLVDASVIRCGQASMIRWPGSFSIRCGDKILRHSDSVTLDWARTATVMG